MECILSLPFLCFYYSLRALTSWWVCDVCFHFDADFSLIENFINENNGDNFPFQEPNITFSAAFLSETKRIASNEFKLNLPDIFLCYRVVLALRQQFGQFDGFVVLDYDRELVVRALDSPFVHLFPCANDHAAAELDESIHLTENSIKSIL